MLVRFFFVSYLHVASDSLSDMNKQIFVLTQQGRNHAVELGGGHENILTPEKSAQNTEYDTQNGP